MKRFCTRCWAENDEAASVCVKCGESLEVEREYVSKLVAALRHPEARTARRAAWILGELRDPRALTPLHDVLDKSHDPYLMADVAEALGKMADPSSLAPLASLLRESSLPARLHSVEAIARIGGPEANRLLLEAKNDPSVLVRAKASEILAAWAKAEVCPGEEPSTTGGRP